MKIQYRAESEWGVKKFKKYRTFIDFMWVYMPRWSHKIKVYKIINGIRYSGQYQKDNRWPIRF